MENEKEVIKQFRKRFNGVDIKTEYGTIGDFLHEVWRAAENKGELDARLMLIKLFHATLENMYGKEIADMVMGIVNKAYAFTKEPGVLAQPLEENLDSKGNCKFCGMPKEMIEEGHWKPGSHKKPCPCNCHPSISNPHPNLDDPNRAMECEHCETAKGRKSAGFSVSGTLASTIPDPGAEMTKNQGRKR